MNFGYFDDDNQTHRHLGVTILAHRSMAQSFRITQVDTAS